MGTTYVCVCVCVCVCYISPENATYCAIYVIDMSDTIENVLDTSLMGYLLLGI